MQIDSLYSKWLTCTEVCTDSRKVSPGSLFVALKGENFNGNTFALEALAKGAAFAVVDEEIFADDERLIFVDNCLLTLQHLAHHHRKQLNVPLLVIAGSNGKTTTKELCTAVAGKEKVTLATEGNFNNHIGVPLTLLRLRSEHEFAIIEIGANHRGENLLLCEIADPDMAVVTNVGKDHLEGFGSEEGVQEANAEVYTYCKSKNALVFLQSGNSDLCRLLGDYRHIITYGTANDNVISGIATASEGYLQVNLSKPFKQLISTRLAGDYNLENVLMAVALGHHLGIAEDSICRAIAEYEPGNKRSQIIRKGSVTIVLDAYNANPSSMEAAIRNFGHSFQGFKVLALGEMKELGSYSSAEHQRMALMAKNIEADIVILVGPEFKTAAEEFKFMYFDEPDSAATWIRENMHDPFSILIKGSRSTQMEKVMNAFP